MCCADFDVIAAAADAAVDAATAADAANDDATELDSNTFEACI